LLLSCKRPVRGNRPWFARSNARGVGQALKVLPPVLDAGLVSVSPALPFNTSVFASKSCRPCRRAVQATAR
jgi:hypothetical protein